MFEVTQLIFIACWGAWLIIRRGGWWAWEVLSCCCRYVFFCHCMFRPRTDVYTYVIAQYANHIRFSITSSCVWPRNVNSWKGYVEGSNLGKTMDRFDFLQREMQTEGSCIGHIDFSHPTPNGCAWVAHLGVLRNSFCRKRASDGEPASNFESRKSGVVVSGWWFGTFFSFPFIGHSIIIQSDFRIFQRARTTTNQVLHFGRKWT